MSSQKPVTQQPGLAGVLPAYKIATPITAATGQEEWQHDLFDCFSAEDNLWLKAWCCPCFVYGKTAARTRDPSMASYEAINPDCLFWFGSSFCSLHWLVNLMKRSEIRDTYNISGDAITDCVFSTWCGCCSLVQNEREVLAKQRSADAAATQGYKAPTGMSTGY